MRIAYYGSEIEFHYETVPPHGDDIFSAKLPLLDIKLPFWIYGRNLMFLDAYYLLAETVKKGTWDPYNKHTYQYPYREICKFGTLVQQYIG